MSHAEATGPRLSLGLRTVDPGCVRAAPEGASAPVPGLGLEAKGGIRADAERLVAAPPAAISAGASMISWMSWEAAGFPIVWLAYQASVRC